MSDIVLARIDLHDIIFPVLAKDANGQLLKPLVYGTAFCIGPGIFATAGHVILNVIADGGTVLLGKMNEDRALGGTEAIRTEIIESHDIGLMLVRAPGHALLHWDEHPRSMMADVSAVGFPYAVTSTAGAFKLTMRSFKGHVITRTAMWSLPAEPVGYEVSSCFPKGMSGAPLIDATAPVAMLQVAGIVVGSNRVRAFGETTRFGIAVDMNEVAKLHSTIVGGTIRELRQAVLEGSEFQVTPELPFLQWPRRTSE